MERCGRESARTGTVALQETWSEASPTPAERRGSTLSRGRLTVGAVRAIGSPSSHLDVAADVEEGDLARGSGALVGRVGHSGPARFSMLSRMR